jgi:hypothetical protein
VTTASSVAPASARRLPMSYGPVSGAEILSFGRLSSGVRRRGSGRPHTHGGCRVGSSAVAMDGWLGGTCVNFAVRDSSLVVGVIGSVGGVR